MRTLLGILMAAGLAACSSGAPEVGDESDDGALTEGDVVPANDPSLWAATDYESFKPWHRSYAHEAGDVLPDDAPVAKRLQTWVDRIDEAIRSDFRARTNTELAAPKPVIKVLVSETLNAWVSSAAVCLSHPLPGAPPPEQCARPTNFQPDDAVILKYLDTVAEPFGCKVERTGDAYAVAPLAGAVCTLTPEYVGSEPWAYLPVTSPYVHITTRMIARVHSEQEIVAILAHELGHYYRAHASGVGNFEPFWYAQAQTPTANRPTPVPDHAALDAQAAKFSTGDAYPLFSGQTLSRRVSIGILQLGYAVASNELATAADAPCKDVFTAYTGAWSGRPFDSNDSAVRAGYLQLEQALLACADQVPVVAATSTERGLKADQVIGALSPLVDTIQPPTTLADVIYAAEGKARALDARERVFAGEIDGRHLGQYTTEEEADDFSLEWAAKIGLAPADVIASHVQTLHNYFEQEPTQFALDGIDWPSCEALYAKKFRDGEGGSGPTRFVPLGDIHEPHHGNCYRVFNLVRAQEAHQFTAAAAAPLPDIDWEAIRADAAHRTDQATAAATAPAAASPPPPAAPSALQRALRRRVPRIVDRY